MLRFIPTGVGNIAAFAAACKVASVHPHGCGEHCGICGGLQSCIGSSPRVWGTCRYTTRILPHCRFIPTGVGNMMVHWGIPIGETVHPHGCGEHISLIFFIIQDSGSSPRVWGTCRGSVYRWRIFRFIPTGVGNIAASHYPFNILSVHPHGCGEHESYGTYYAQSYGSSPRVWGTWSIEI